MSTVTAPSSGYRSGLTPCQQVPEGWQMWLIKAGTVPMTFKAREVPLTVALVLGLHLRTTCACPSFLLKCVVGTKVSMGCVPLQQGPFFDLLCAFLFFHPGQFLPLLGPAAHCWRAGGLGGGE